MSDLFISAIAQLKPFDILYHILTICIQYFSKILHFIYYLEDDWWLNCVAVVKPPPPRDYIASRSSPKIQIHVPAKYLVRESGLSLTSVPSGQSTSEQKPEDDFTTTTVEEILPFFEEAYNMTNVTTQLGQNVYLHCRVNDLKDKTVKFSILKTIEYRKRWSENFNWRIQILVNRK